MKYELPKCPRLALRVIKNHWISGNITTAEAQNELEKLPHAVLLEELDTWNCIAYAAFCKRGTRDERLT